MLEGVLSAIAVNATICRKALCLRTHSLSHAIRLQNPSSCHLADAVGCLLLSI